MNLNAIIVDDFLDDFSSFEAIARSLDYSGEVNPIDGVMYPDISSQVPVEISLECLTKLGALLGVSSSSIKVSIPPALRLTTEGTLAPHQAHTDQVMGAFNFILYLNDGGPTEGTSILKHKSGMVKCDTDEQKSLLTQDTNNYDAWDVIGMTQARKNRAAIIPSANIHRAEPPGGYGSSVADGRLVFLIFFSLETQ